MIVNYEQKYKLSKRDMYEKYVLEIHVHVIC